MGHMKNLDIVLRNGGQEAVDAVNRMAADIEAMMPRWIPAGERLPDEYEVVMVGWAGRRDIGKGYLLNGKWHDPLVCKPDVNPPTHWMPLPEHPAK